MSGSSRWLPSPGVPGPLGAGLLCLWLASMPILPAYSAQIVDVRLGEHPTFTRLVIELDEPPVFALEHDPEAAALNVRVDAVAEKKSIVWSGRLIESVEVEPTDLGAVARVRLNASDVAIRDEVIFDPPRIVLDVTRPGRPVAAPVAFAEPAEAPPDASTPQPLAAEPLGADRPGDDDFDLEPPVGPEAATPPMDSETPVSRNQSDPATPDDLVEVALRVGPDLVAPATELDPAAPTPETESVQSSAGPDVAASAAGPDVAAPAVASAPEAGFFGGAELLCAVLAAAGFVCLVLGLVVFRPGRGDRPHVAEASATPDDVPDALASANESPSPWMDGGARETPLPSSASPDEEEALPPPEPEPVPEPAYEITPRARPGRVSSGSGPTTMAAMSRAR